MTPYLFVYASLRKGFRSPAYRYITQYFKPAGDAYVHGCFYEANGIPVAVPSDAEQIPGELYELSDPDNYTWAITQLDDYEGLNVEEGQLPDYKREIVTAWQNDKPVQAWIYWFNRPVIGLHPIPVEEVLRFIDSMNKDN